MTPRAPDSKRVEELREWLADTDLSVQGKAQRNYYRISDERQCIADLILILSDYSALKAENERLQRQVKIEQRKVSDLDGLLAKYHEAAEKAEAQLEKLKADFSEALKIGYDQQADLEKFRPLIEAAEDVAVKLFDFLNPGLDRPRPDLEEMHDRLTAALKLREEGK